jgi:hypothetical protein
VNTTKIVKTLQFLRSNQNALVDYVQAQQRAIPADDGSIYYKLVQELRTEILTEKNGIQGGVDKMHVELAFAILEAMWCGWLSQAKTNNGRYSIDAPEKFKEVILNAYEIGKALAATKL